MCKNLLTICCLVVLLSTPASGVLYVGVDVPLDYELQIPGEAGRYATMLIIDSYPTLEDYSANMNILVRYENPYNAYSLFGFAWSTIEGLEADIIENAGLHSLGEDGFYWDGMSINPDENAQWFLYDAPYQTGDPTWSLVPTGAFESMTVASGGWLGAVLNSATTPTIHTPEPAMICLLGGGVLFLVRKRRV